MGYATSADFFRCGSRGVAGTAATAHLGATAVDATVGGGCTATLTVCGRTGAEILQAEACFAANRVPLV